MLSASVFGGPTDTPVERTGERKPLIAPWWHTVLIVAIILAVAVLGLLRRSDAAIAQHHVREYGATLGWEWLLLAFTLGGVWLRSRSAGVRELLGPRRYSWAQDAWAAALFWIPSTIALGALGALLKRAGAGTPQQVLSAIAPHTAAELALFLALSASAGFCEELIFRGYLMEQCTRLAALVSRGRGDRIPVWAGALASSIVFGTAHLYEGVSGVGAITVFGLMFAWLALRRRSLRAGMIVHAWHDAVSGIALYLLTRAHAI
jgi:membrane protease YdiL (CAAX protease family)